MLKNILPKNTSVKLLKEYGTAKVLKRNKGRLQNEIYKISDSRKGNCYLNIAKDFGKYELDSEHDFLKTYKEKLLIPDVLFYEKNDEYSYLIISCIEGKPLHEVIQDLSKTQIIDIVGESLLQIISTPVESNTMNGLEKELEEIKKILVMGRLNRKKFLKDNKCEPEEMFDTILEEKENHSFNILSHGDYCIPNLIVNDNYKVEGIIDWGKSGKGDLHRDLAALEGSMIRNIGHSGIKELFHILNIDFHEFSNKKKNLYNKIDQFWYNLIF